MSDARSYNYKAMLLVGDLVAFAAALFAASVVRYHWNPAGLFRAGRPPWTELLGVLPYALMVWAVSLRFNGAYRLGLRLTDEALRILRSLVTTFLLLGAATFFYRGYDFSRAVVLLMIPLTFVASLLLRTTLRFLWDHVLRLEPARGRTLVVGTGPVARHLVASLGARACPEVGGVVREDGEAVESIEGVPVLGALDDLGRILASRAFQTVVVAGQHVTHETQLAIAEACLQHGCRYQVVPDIYELMLDRVQVDVVGGLPLLGLRTNNLTGVNAVIKRLFDVVGATLLLLAASPLLLVTAVGIKLSSKGPVFFTQERLGLHGRPFRFIKFRSMHVDTDDSVHRDYVRKWIGNEAAEEKDGEKTFKLTSDPRIFRFGAFIRKYSIDELPQLVNVLKGDMSLVGPRPPISYEVEAYREWHKRRFEALPGITGLWQVSGRNRLSFDEMVKLDIEYIENWSLALDIKITLRTAYVVFAGSAY